MPVLVAQVDGQAVEFELGNIFDRRRLLIQASSRRTLINLIAPASLMSVSVRIDSIGRACTTGLSSASTPPPMRCVGDAGDTSCGCATSAPATPERSRSYSASATVGRSST
jgi:hypothetical protein